MYAIAWPDECNAEDYFAPELIASKGSMGTSCDAHVLSLRFCADMNHLLNDCQNSHHLPLQRLLVQTNLYSLLNIPFLCFLETFEVFSLMSFDVI